MASLFMFSIIFGLVDYSVFPTVGMNAYVPQMVDFAVGMLLMCLRRGGAARLPGDGYLRAPQTATGLLAVPSVHPLASRASVPASHCWVANPAKALCKKVLFFCFCAYGGDVV